MIRFLSTRVVFRFSSFTFKTLAQSLKSIQQQSSRLSKISIFSKYISNLNQAQQNTLRNLFQLSFNKFSRIDDKILINNCKLLNINSQKLNQSLQQENNVIKLISKLYGFNNLLNINKPQRQTQKVKILTIDDIYQKFLEIKSTEGKSSVLKKFLIMNKLLQATKEEYERRIILSMMTNNFQIGFNKISIIKVFEQFKPKLKSENQQKYDCMLTKPLKDFQEAIKFIKNSDIAVEYKFDGERTHLQYVKGSGVNLFSRRGKSQFQKYEDLFGKIQKQLEEIQGLDSCILDGEIISVDRQDKVTPIQILLNRKNRTKENLNSDVEKLKQDENYSERIMIFDILEKNGQSLLNIPYKQRIQSIPIFKQKNILKNVSRQFFSLPNDLQKFKSFFQEAVKNGYEGLILKKVDSKYNTQKSRVDWAKLKKGDSEQGTTGRSVDVDLIMMGGYKGKGKRQGVIGSFLFGTMHNGKIYPITKTGTSLTDIKFKQVTQMVKRYADKTIPEEYIIPKSIDLPDIWIKPHFVVEISSQQWTRSPVYPFHSNDQGGLSLRFPRFIRMRDDKSIQDATSGQQIIDQFNKYH